MNKFGLYLKGCKECVSQVDDILSSGEVVLTSNEKLDYYFKSLVIYRTEFKQLIISREYRLAKFYQVCFDEMKKVYCYGYDNHSALKSIRKINKAAFLYLGKCSKSVIGYDESGSYYIIIDDLRDSKYEMDWDIHGDSSLIETIEDMAKYYVECAGGYGDFGETYLTRVLNDLYEGVKVVPYTNMSDNKTLWYGIAEKTTVSNVIQFKNLGGVANGRNGRDVLYG